MRKTWKLRWLVLAVLTAFALLLVSCGSFAMNATSESESFKQTEGSESVSDSETGAESEGSKQTEGSESISDSETGGESEDSKQTEGSESISDSETGGENESTSDSTAEDGAVYSITYLDAPTNNNPTTYTANDHIVLLNAYWPGLSFSHWSDRAGNVVEEIPVGSEGNITLVANWKYTENLAISNNADAPALSIYNEQMNAYQFVYDLGTVYNVVLDELSAYKYNGATNHTWTVSETVSFTESNAKNVASTISKSVTSSNSWSRTVSSVKSNSTSYDASLSMDFEMGSKFSPLQVSIGTAFGVGTDSSSSNTTSSSGGGSSGSTSGQSETVSSTLTFVSDTTTQVTRSESLTPGLSPAGLYRYVYAGDVKVLAVVTYDVATKDYHINLLSYVTRTYETMLYETVPEYSSKVNIVDSDPFEFDVDAGKIAEDVIGNSYYVEFSANGGSGTMAKQMILSGASVALCRNQFTKAGSTFVGWRVVGGDNSTVYLDGQKVKDLCVAKGTVRLEAIWTSTEPVWVESGSGSFYFGDIPSTVDMDHQVLKNMKTEAYVAYETETVKRVVTVEKVGYVYWHWMYDTKAAGSSERAIYHKQGIGPDTGYSYKYFFAFTSAKGNYSSDKYYCNSQGMTNYIVNDQKTSNAECGGATRWFRFEYYICTYTDYVLSE